MLRLLTASYFRADFSSARFSFVILQFFKTIKKMEVCITMYNHIPDKKNLF